MPTRAALMLVPVLLAGCQSSPSGKGPLFTLGPLSTTSATGPQLYVDLVDTRAPWERRACVGALPPPLPDEPPARLETFFTPTGEMLDEDADEAPLLLTCRPQGTLRALHFLIEDAEQRPNQADLSQQNSTRRAGEVLSLFSIGLCQKW